MANDKTSSGTQMCDGAGDWSDCTARWQAMGGRRIKRSAGHERVAIPATVNICRAAAPCERDAVADNSQSREQSSMMAHLHPWILRSLRVWYCSLASHLETDSRNT